MATQTKNFSLNSIQDFISDLKDARDITDAEEKKANIAALSVGIMLGFAATPITGAIVATALYLSNDWDNLGNLCTSAIEDFEDYEDFLQNNSDYYDMLRVEISYKTISYGGKTYYLPTKLEVVALHCTNPIGWSML